MQFKFYEPCVVADIPGLIEGAHQGVGLGHKFLRHIERTRILLHVIDASGAAEAPWRDYQTLDQELRQYKDELSKRQRIVVLNKLDLLEEEERAAELTAVFKEHGLKVMTISALTGQGLDD